MAISGISVSVTIPLDSALNFYTHAMKRIAKIDEMTEDGFNPDGDGSIRKSYQMAADEIVAAIKEEMPNYKP